MKSSADAFLPVLADAAVSGSGHEQPLDVIPLFDTSNSMRRVVARVAEAAHVAMGFSRRRTAKAQNGTRRILNRHPMMPAITIIGKSPEQAVHFAASGPCIEQLPGKFMNARRQPMEPGN